MIYTNFRIVATSRDVGELYTTSIILLYKFFLSFFRESERACMYEAGQVGRGRESFFFLKFI